MQRSLVLLAFTALILASSTEARRLWQFPGFGGAAAPTAAGPMMPGAVGAGTAPTTGSGSSIVDDAVAEAVAAAQAELAGAGAAAAEPEPAAAATAQPAAAATTAPAVATATATATGTPGNPGAAAAVADSTRGVAAGATGASTATAGAGGETVTAAGVEEEEEPAAPAGPQIMRPGVYVIADPPPPPKPKPAAVAANATAGRNVTAGPPMPAPGKNLMVVLTLMGQQAKDIYKNQKSIRDEVAQAAGVGSNQVLFFNQTTNQDPKTGVTAMSLIMNVDCKDQAECGRAGVKLFNSSSQTRLTDALARNSVSMLPGTFQVYGVQQMGAYKGNATLFENKALTQVRPKTTDTDMDYNSTLARVFAGMEDEPAPGAKPRPGSRPAGALPGDIPLAGTPGLFGNFSIPMDNLPQSSFAGMGNATQLSPFGALNAPLPGLQNTTDPLADAELEPANKAKSSAGGFTAGLLPLVAAVAAVLVL